MEKTLTDPDFTETSAQKNLQLSKKYSIETTAKDYVSLYKKILSKKFKRE
jgi:glycogen synthase